MSQPPAGGYPPPDPSQPGAYPPPAQPGPPGGYQPPPGGYPPPPPYSPPAYTPPGASPVGGPPPGYAPPPAGGYPPPPAAGYPPPAGGYPPAAPGYGAPGAPAYPPAGGAAAKPSFDMSKVTQVGWGVMGATLLTLIASFFNFWSVSYGGVSYGGYNGWSLWWWIPVLLAVAVGVIYALTLFGVLKPGQVKPLYLFYGAAASFVLMILVLIHTFAYNGPGGVFTDSVLGDTGVSSGPSFGVWFALITTLALTYFAALAAQNSGSKLPFKIPGPALR